MSKNPVIVFEGIEASGKSYHIKNVSNYLKKIDRKFILIREPGGNKNSEKIRNLILEKNLHLIRIQIYYYINLREAKILILFVKIWERK